MKGVKILFKSFFIILFLLSSKTFSDTLNKIEIIGNDRITDETIKLFISVDIKDEINESKLNNIIKDLYDTDFFKDISVKFNNQILSINVLENPIIENISYIGIKSDTIL
jgi:outer membrane protein insertion porin family